MTVQAMAVSAFAAGRGDDAAALVFLDVLPARTAVISFYRRLGDTETGPFGTESPIPMVHMQRPVTSDDILSIPRS